MRACARCSGSSRFRAAARTRWCASAVRGRCGSKPIVDESPGVRRRSAVDATAEWTSTRARYAGRSPTIASRSSVLGGAKSGHPDSSQPCAPDRPVRIGPHEFGDEREAVSCRSRRAQVETGEHQPGRGEMHMAVDERRRNEAAVEIDDLGVGELGEADVVAAQPHDGACADCHRGGVRHGRTVDPAALQKRGQLSRACEAMPGVRHLRCRHRRRGHHRWRRRRRR